MWDLDEIINGYTKENEFIARDLIIIELLIKKGILTYEEVNEAYLKLSDKIEEVKRIQREDIEKRIKELKEEVKGGA